MADTLGVVPGLDGMTQSVSGTPIGVDALGTANADAVGLGETTFDNAQQTSNVMSDLHMPNLDAYGVTTNADGSFNDGKASGWRAQVVAAAKKMLGTPYVWGGTSYGGVDCSGLVQLIYNSHGFNLPRISADQARSGQRINDFSQLEPGDLVAIDNSSRNNGADHIAIYIGNGQVIEAPRPGRNVQVASVNEFRGGWGIHLNQ